MKSMSDRIDTASEHRLQEYLSRLTAVLGHADRKQRLVGYCTGLLLPGERKSIEPMAARLDPAQVPSLHQARVCGLRACSGGCGARLWLILLGFLV